MIFCIWILLTGLPQNRCCVANIFFWGPLLIFLCMVILNIFTKTLHIYPIIVFLFWMTQTAVLIRWEHSLIISFSVLHFWFHELISFQEDILNLENVKILNCTRGVNFHYLLWESNNIKIIFFVQMVIICSYAHGGTNSNPN